jgi:hypothetical protein
MLISSTLKSTATGFPTPNGVATSYIAYVPASFRDLLLIVIWPGIPSKSTIKGIYVNGAFGTTLYVKPPQKGTSVNENGSIIELSIKILYLLVVIGLVTDVIKETQDASYI